MATDELDYEQAEQFLNENEDFLDTLLVNFDIEQKDGGQPRTVTPTLPPALTTTKCIRKLVRRQSVYKPKVFDETMSENQRFSEYVKDIAGELNVDRLSHKILQNVISLTESEHGRLFLVEELDERCLVSKLFHVTSASRLGDAIVGESMEIRIPFGKGIAGTVAQTKAAMNIKDAEHDPRFDPLIDGLPGYEIRCILSIPIVNKARDVVGVAEIMNKKHVEHYSAEDQALSTDYISFCGIGINNARIFQTSLKEITRNQILLNLAWQISIGQSSIDKLAKVILETAVKLINCKFAKLYLVDKKGELFSKVYRFDYSELELTIKKGEPADIYGIVAKKTLDRNKTINLINLASERECVSADYITSCDTNESKMKAYEEDANWTLCTPLRNEFNQCIGCILFAGRTKPIWNDSDVNSVEAFAIYSSLGIHNYQLYEATYKSLLNKEVTMEILSYHLISEREEVNRFVISQNPFVNDCNLYAIDFNDVILNDESTIQFVGEMFIKLDALDILGITVENLYRWIVTVKKNYKPLLYHNWRHVLNVTQIMFCALSNGSLKDYFFPLERICLLVATLCHDLDYQRCASADKLKSTSLLATVYSTSSSENQILGRCVTILSADETNIFINVPTEKYREAMEFIKRAILSTDIHGYILNADYFEQLKKKHISLFNAQDKEMLIRLAMVCCDLNAFSKEWDRHKMIVLADVLDLLEPRENGAAWLSKSDVNKVPRMMVDFIDAICLKAFKTMVCFDNTFTRLYEACLKNRQTWEYMAEHADEFDVENELMKSRAGLTDVSSSAGSSHKRNR